MDELVLAIHSEVFRDPLYVLRAMSFANHFGHSVVPSSCKKQQKHSAREGNAIGDKAVREAYSRPDT